MSTHYVADIGHRPIPLAADNPYRGPSQRPPKPKGLDWAALTPKCRACGEKSTKLNRDDWCPACAAPPAAAEEPQRPKPKRKTKRGGRARRASQPPREGRARRSDKITLDVDQVAADYAAGLTLAQVAEKHGVSHPVIARHLDQAGVARRGAPIAYTPELIEQIRTLYVDERLTQTQVADRLGLTQKVVQSAMRHGNIPARGDAVARSKEGLGGRPIKLNADQRTEIVRRYLEGETGPALGRAYGVSAVAIYHVLQRAGVDRRRS